MFWRYSRCIPEFSLQKLRWQGVLCTYEKQLVKGNPTSGSSRLFEELWGKGSSPMTSLFLWAVCRRRSEIVVSPPMKVLESFSGSNQLGKEPGCVGGPRSCTAVSQTFKVLGITFGVSKATHFQNWEKLIESYKSKISWWQRCQLPVAEKITLRKTYLLGSGVFLSIVFLLLASTLMELNQQVFQFLGTVCLSPKAWSSVSPSVGRGLRHGVFGGYLWNDFFNV